MRKSPIGDFLTTFLSERRQDVLDDMVSLAQSLPEYDILLSIPDIVGTTIGEIGDIRRSLLANQLHTFIDIE